MTPTNGGAAPTQAKSSGNELMFANSASLGSIAQSAGAGDRDEVQPPLNFNMGRHPLNDGG
eukprot:7113439-Heterocapsa_arctica.AAC.1